MIRQNRRDAPDVAHLRAQLAAALQDGADTAGIRRDIDAAESELQACAREAEERDMAAARDADLAVEAAAATVAGEAVERVQASIAHHVMPPPPEPSSGAIEVAARRLVQARAERDRAFPASAAARDGVARIEARERALEGRRADLLRRRAAGEAHPEDATVLRLLDADIEGIKAMLVDARACEANAAAPVRRAEEAIAHAQHDIARAESAAIEVALVAYAEAIDPALIALVSALKKFHDRNGGRLRWRPSATLIADLGMAAILSGRL